MSETDGLVLLAEAWPPVVGRPAITQGVYGDHGNLELVCCAADYGLLVGWFNADTIDRREGAGAGCWSGALRFGGRDRYVSAAITQVSHGPRFLEVLATTIDGDLHRHVWSPDPGFVDHGPIASGILAHSGIVETGTGALVTAVAGTPGCRLLHAEPGTDYPQLAFDGHPLQAPTGVVDVDCAGHEDHHDVLTTADDGSVSLTCAASSTALAQGMQSARLTRSAGASAVLLLGAGQAHVHDLATGRIHHLGPAEDGALALSTIDGRRRWEVILRDGASLRHTRIPLEDNGQTTQSSVLAQVWAPPGTETVHRPPESF